MTKSTVVWSGDLPGYGALNKDDHVVSVPNEQKVVRGMGFAPLPERVNWVEMSEGGKWAWQGHESGLVYEGLTSTGLKGYGQHSFLYVGEDLRVFTDVETYQQTAGGWRYVSDSGSLVGYGATYSGPPLWEWTEHGGIRVGQGPEDNDGVCVLIDGQVRQLEAGDYRSIQFRLYGPTARILAVNYAGHYTSIWTITVDELWALPLLTHAPAPSQPPKEEPPVTTPAPTIPNHQADIASVRAHYPTPLGATHPAFLIEAAQRVGGFLLRKDSGTHVTLPNGTNVSQDIIVMPGGQGFDVLGDGDGAATPQWNQSDMFTEDRLVDVSQMAPGSGSGGGTQPAPAPSGGGADGTVTSRLDSLEAAVATLTNENVALRSVLHDVDEELAAHNSLLLQLHQVLSQPISTSRDWGHSHHITLLKTEDK